jgi:hypothetical protein
MRTRPFGWLAASTVAVLGITAGPVVLGAGAAGLRVSLIAAAVCLAPSAATLALALSSTQRGATWQLAAILGGMVLRMLTVLGVALALVLWVGAVAEYRALFLILLVIYYLANMGTEAFVLVQSRREQAPQKP